MLHRGNASCQIIYPCLLPPIKQNLYYPLLKDRVFLATSTTVQAVLMLRALIGYPLLESSVIHFSRMGFSRACHMEHASCVAPFWWGRKLCCRSVLKKQKFAIQEVELSFSLVGPFTSPSIILSIFLPPLILMLCELTISFNCSVF